MIGFDPPNELQERYDALQQTHVATLNRLARLERAVEALNLTDEHVEDGYTRHEYVSVVRSVKDWRELREALG